MDNYQTSDTPGMVIKNGAEVDALAEIEELSDLLEEALDDARDARADLEDAESEINGLEQAMSEHSGVDIGEVERIVDRIRYACSSEAEKSELRALLALFAPDNYIELLK